MRGHPAAGKHRQLAGGGRERVFLSRVEYSRTSKHHLVRVVTTGAVSRSPTSNDIASVVFVSKANAENKNDWGLPYIRF